VSSRTQERARSRDARDRLSGSAPVRWFAAHPHGAAALLLGLLVLAYLRPALLGGEMLSPLAVLYGLVPWQGHAPSDILDYYNPLLSDVAQAHHPWNAFAREAIRDGVLPAWNPHVLAGVPFFSNPQTVLFSPFSLPLWILPLNYAVGVSAALKLWAAGFGTYLLVRELRIGFLPALLAAVAYMLCSFHVVWLTHESLPGVSAMLPWMLWLVERVLRRGSSGAALGLALATGIAMAGGHPGTQLHVLAATALYAVVRVASVPDLDRVARAKRLGLAGGGVVMGMLLVAVMFLPELLSSRGTLGTTARAEGGQSGSDMPLDVIRTVLFPDWWSRPSGLESAAGPPPEGFEASVIANYNERTFFAGVVPLLLACVGLASPGGWRRKAPFVVLGAVALGIVLRAPGLHWLVTHLPAFDVVQNQRAHFVFELAVAVVAAFGLQALLDGPRESSRRRLAVPLLAVLLGVAAIASIGPSGSDVGDVLEHFATGADVATDAALQLTTVTWFLLFAVAIGVALLAAWRWPRQVMAIGAVLVLLAAVDMLRFADGYQPMAPASKVIPPRTAAIEFLQRESGDSRFLGLDTALINAWGATMYRLRDVRGYDPPYPTLRYYDLWRTANPAQINWQTLTIEGIGPAGLRVASVLGVRYVLAPAGAEGVGGTDADEPIRRVYAGDDATIFENRLAAPRVLVPQDVTVADSAAAARAEIVSDGFDPRRTAVVERDEVGASAGGLAGAGTVAVSREENAEVQLDVALDRRGLVVLNDSMVDGWSVEIDGEPAQALHVNTVMRGVVVDAGRHEVVWSYRVPGLRLGLAISLLAAAALLAGTILLLVRRRNDAG
jgi:hypothetical protein